MKKLVLDLAEGMDAYRIFPRLFVGMFYMILVDTHYWFLGIEAPSTQQVSYVTAVWGATAAVTKFYVDSGRKWT